MSKDKKTEREKENICWLCPSVQSMPKQYKEREWTEMDKIIHRGCVVTLMSTRASVQRCWNNECRAEKPAKMSGSRYRRVPQKTIRGRLFFRRPPDPPGFLIILTTFLFCHLLLSVSGLVNFLYLAGEGFFDCSKRFKKCFDYVIMNLVCERATWGIQGQDVSATKRGKE